MRPLKRVTSFRNDLFPWGVGRETGPGVGGDSSCQPKPATADPALVASGKTLFEKWQCVKCHVVAGKLPNQEPANMAPDLAKVPGRLRADWIARWLTEPTKIQPGTRMPTNFPSDPTENAFPEILGGDQKKQIEAVRAYVLTLGNTKGSN